MAADAKSGGDEFDVPEMPESDQRSDKKPGMSIKDWVAICLSLCAFAISACGFYLNSVRQIDDLRIVLGDSFYLPSISLDAKTRELNVSSREGPLTFMNLGTRPIAITRASFVIVQPGDRLIPQESMEKCKSYDDDNEAVLLDFQPFAIKAGEIISKDMKFKKSTLDRVLSNGDFVFDVTAGNLHLEHAYLAVGCLALSVVTPGMSADFLLVPLYSSHFPAPGYDSSYKQKLLFDPKKPLPVVQRTGTIFAD